MAQKPLNIRGNFDMKKTLKQYLGEYVAVYLKNPIIIGVDSKSGQSMVSAALGGYVIDIDDHFIHLGDSEEEISRSIVLSELTVIEVKDEYAEAIEFLDVPEDKEFH